MTQRHDESPEAQNMAQVRCKQCGKAKYSLDGRGRCAACVHGRHPHRERITEAIWEERERTGSRAWNAGGAVGDARPVVCWRCRERFCPAWWFRRDTKEQKLARCPHCTTEVAVYLAEARR